MPIVVKKQKGETKDDLIGRFRRLFIEEEIIDEIKSRIEYVKGARKRYEEKKAKEKLRKKSSG